MEKYKGSDAEYIREGGEEMDIEKMRKELENRVLIKIQTMIKKMNIYIHKKIER